MNRNSYCNSGTNDKGPSSRIITGVKLNECNQLDMA